MDRAKGAEIRDDPVAMPAFDRRMNEPGRPTWPASMRMPY